MPPFEDTSRHISSARSLRRSSHQLRDKRDIVQFGFNLFYANGFTLPFVVTYVLMRVYLGAEGCPREGAPPISAAPPAPAGSPLRLGVYGWRR